MTIVLWGSCSTLSLAHFFSPINSIASRTLFGQFGVF